MNDFINISLEISNCKRSFHVALQSGKSCIANFKKKNPKTVLFKQENFDQ